MQDTLYFVVIYIIMLYYIYYSQWLRYCYWLIVMMFVDVHDWWIDRRGWSSNFIVMINYVDVWWCWCVMCTWIPMQIELYCDDMYDGDGWYLDRRQFISNCICDGRWCLTLMARWKRWWRLLTDIWMEMKFESFCACKWCGRLLCRY